MKHQRKNKMGSKGPKECGASKSGDAPSDGEIVWRRLLEPFAYVSIEEAELAYKEANGDLNRAAEILQNLEESAEDQSTSSSIASWYASSSSSSSDMSGEDHCAQYEAMQKSKAKRVVASAGTVSTVLGKDYVSSLPKKSSSGKNPFNCESYSKEDSEQFLCSMLGEECQLSLAVVRDVLCQCGYDFNKALNILLELSSSSAEIADNREEPILCPESNDEFTGGTFDSSYSSACGLQEKMSYAENPCRSQISFLHDNEHSSPPRGNSASQLSKEVLESLFNMPSPKIVEHEPGALKWKDVVTKMTSLRLNSEPSPASSVAGLNNTAKGEDYQVFREVSTHHWQSMKSYYQKAASAFTSGQRQYAAYLAEQGRAQNRKALEAEEKASQNIFEARNKSIENVITIDMHGQHVKQAMRLLKLHLLFGAFGRSVRQFRVITGSGGQGLGKSKLKLAVTNLLEREGIEWREENSGTLLIKLQGQTSFSFLDAPDSDDE
ncbi:hypothetical protein DM860_012459 [Cuscuta australis]|uniref:Smr domain-containing protein n=1 Tax=Cuscuta australis TaxID=267555 RepID=A0A328DFL2_9ASTE|nr:hypothetical protein DM860_012459 [Cuscuta australis]